MKFFVTGATGFVGSWVVDRILRDFPEAEVTCLVRASSNLRWLEGKKVRLHRGSLLAPETLREPLQESEFVLHIAGVTKAWHPRLYYEGNVEVCRQLYAAAGQWGKRLKQIVHLSSQAVVGPSPGPEPLFEEAPPNPLTDYGRSKWMGEQVAHEWMDRLPIVILRPPAVYGPRDTDFFHLFRNVRRGWNITVGKVDPLVSLIYVEDLARAILLAATQARAVGHTYFVCDDRPYRGSEIVTTLAHLMGVSVRHISIPQTLAYGVAAMLEVWSTLRRQPTILNRQKIREIAQPCWVISNQKIRKELGFHPEFTLQEGLRRTLEWYRQQGWLS